MFKPMKSSKRHTSSTITVASETVSSEIKEVITENKQ